MKRLMLLTAAFAFSASVAMASVAANDLVAAYQAQGYTKIEVITGPTQIKVEAVKGTSRIEVIYDASSGSILQQENKWAKRSQRGAGVTLSTSTGDFLNGGDGSTGNDDGTGDDANTDSGQGSGDGAGHDANDGKDGKGDHVDQGDHADQGDKGDKGGNGGHSGNDKSGNDD